MTRKEFVKMCSLLGIGLPLMPGALMSCKEEVPNFTGKVLVIGAGAAGISAANALQEQGATVEILEASDHWGGRMVHNTTFADFPIPLGAEWLHNRRRVLGEVMGQSNAPDDIETVGYKIQDSVAFWNGSSLDYSMMGVFRDLKFVNSSWYAFFEQYLVPPVADLITYNTAVTAIDYSTDQIQVSTQGGKNYTADRVIVTVPVKMLQDGFINFTPALPTNKQEALEEAYMPGGIKVFMTFDQKFYPVFTEFKTDKGLRGERVYYDAAYGQNSNQNIMALFAIGQPAAPYLDLDDDALIAYVLQELDEMFNGQASRSLQKHLIQNWLREPYIRGAYSEDFKNWRTVRTLSETVNGRLYFAGEAYADDGDWGYLHTAARAGRRAANEILFS